MTQRLFIKRDTVIKGAAAALLLIGCNFTPLKAQVTAPGTLPGAAAGTAASAAAEAGDNFARRIFQGSGILTTLSPEFRTIYTAPFVRPTADDSGDTFRATAFAPLIFDVGKLLSLTTPEPAIQSIVAMTNRTLFPQAEPARIVEKAAEGWISETAFGRNQTVWEEAMALREHIFRTNPDMVRGTTASLPTDNLADSEISRKVYDGVFEVPADKAAMVEGVAIEGEKIDPKYWTTAFQADLHFAQNEISSNWYKGGQSNLNLNGRLFFDATYTRDKFKWVNQFEYKVGIFTQTNPDQRKIQIGEDIFSIISNLGLQATDHWFYTLDGMLRTQMLNNYSTDNVLVTRTFAPLKVDLGLGMKYDIDIKEFRGDPFARFRFTANLSPLSAQLIHTWSDEVDKARVGLQPDQNFLFRLGSTIRTNLIWDFTSYFYWESRFLYNTSYKHVETEFENNLYYSFSRFFSLKLGINLRFDDSVILDEPKTIKNLLQYNQIFSLGFTYKL